MIYLIQYDRKLGELVSAEEFPAGCMQQAEEARIGVELDLLGRQISREVVILEASNKDELRKSHRRYFERLDQLLDVSPATAQ